MRVCDILKEDHEPGEVMAWSTLEQLKALRASARKPALDREDRILHQKYVGQYVAYTDDWNGDELVRTVVAATPDLAEFQRFHATLRAKSGRVKAVAVPPAEPLPEPPPEERGATLDQLKALTAKTPAQKDALRREDFALCDKYPGQWVAFIDEWNGEELIRTVLITGTEYGPFYEQVDKLSPEVRSRLDTTRTPEPGVFEVPSVWLE